MTVSVLLSELLKRKPDRPLYHYTSFGALASIASAKVLWASEVSYLNDSRELLIAKAEFSNIARRTYLHDPEGMVIHRQLSEWLETRFGLQHQVFVVCLTSLYDKLSQWRGYTPSGRGAMLFFNSETFNNVAAEQGYSFGAVHYHGHENIAGAAISRLVEDARETGPRVSPSHQNASYFPAFERCELDLLKIAALLKHEAFAEEQEWRAVIGHPISHVDGLLFRESKSALIPYRNLRISSLDTMTCALAGVMHGPTPNEASAKIALRQLLTANGIPCDHISGSTAPYRDV